MRKAQLEIGEGSAKAEVTFFQFGGGRGGTAADNVARWFGPLPAARTNGKTENIQAGSVKITFASTEGTFSSACPAVRRPR